MPIFEQHHVSGTYVVPLSLVSRFTDLYLSKLVELDSILTEQIVLTLLFESNRDLFHCVAHGYGVLFPKFYEMKKMKMLICNHANKKR